MEHPRHDLCDLGFEYHRTPGTSAEHYILFRQDGKALVLYPPRPDVGNFTAWHAALTDAGTQAFGTPMAGYVWGMLEGLAIDNVLATVYNNRTL